MLRHVTLWVIVSFCAGLGLASLAAASPINGYYKSTELSGTVFMGRWSEGYAGGIPNSIGDGSHAASWDGSTLGGQWEFTGARLSGTTILFGNPLVDGTFAVKRDFNVAGAQLLLKKDGGAAPWWGGDAVITEYGFDLTTYYQVLTATVVSGTVQYATSTEVFAGTYAATGHAVTGHTVGIYESVGLTLPPNYPAFEGTGTVTGGAWGTVEGTRMTITPEPATLSLLAVGGLAMVARRRRR